MVFELSLTPIVDTWYHDFMTEGVSPANKDESGITRRAGWVYKHLDLFEFFCEYLMILS